MGTKPEGLKLIVKGKRLDGRKPEEMRPLKMKVGVVKNADGSAYVELGGTKVIASVYGPREVHPKHNQKDDTGILSVRYNMTPFSVVDRKRPGPDRRSVEISKVARCALEPAIFLKEFPQLGIDLSLEVIQADAGTRVTAITAGALALAHAGIPMKGLVAACAAGKIDGQIVLDLMGKEDNYGEADLPVAMLSSNGKITLLQLDGNLTKDELKKAFELTKKGNEVLFDAQRKALLEFYGSEKKGEE